MTIEEQLRDLMIKKSGSVNKFSQEIGVPQSTIFSIFQRGVGKANINSIITICKALNISTDELAEGRITPLPVETMPAGTYRGAPSLEVLPNLWVDFESLSDKNKEQVASYIQFLKKMQEEGDDK